MSNIKVLPNGISVLESDTHISRWVEQSGRLCHDDCVVLFILPLIKPGFVVIDGGAFIGDHTTAYLEKVGPTGSVLAFEPNPDAYECLVRNCPKAQKYRYALSNVKGWCHLSIGENAGGSHLSDMTGIDVQTIPLDYLNVPKVDFIKLDLEGYEVFALQGAKNTITTNKPVMVIEMNDGALRRHGHSPDTLKTELHSLGYEFRSLNPGLKMDEPQLDILCEPKK